ncbi:MAG TPA: glycosyltransferase family 1 protein [Candidatus Dormibacteraeota bacterium]|nr:glycosyltransferase family 1 protein [Candidatus Dormibacteraeota bacterium]
MKIGIVGPNAQPGRIGGLEILFLNLIKFLGEYDKENSYTLYLPEVYDKKIDLPGNFTLVRPQSKLDWWGYLDPRVWGRPNYRRDQGLRRFFANEPVDLLHFPFTTIHPQGIKKKKVLTFADLQQEYFPEFFDEAELVHRRLSYKPSAMEADHIISISNYTKKGLVEKYNIPAEKITTIYLTFNKDIFTSGAKPVKSEYPYFFYPAGRWQHKNHSRLINAFAAVAKQNASVRLKLTGTVQSQDEAIASQIKSLGLGGRIDFLGHVSEKQLPDLYRGATALIFPSLFEGFGIPIVEAMASGCPVACSNTTSLPEVGGQAALYFDPAKESEITDAMIRLLNDESLRQRLAKLGFDQVRKFTPEAMARQTVKIYELVNKEKNETY